MYSQVSSARLVLCGLAFAALLPAHGATTWSGRSSGSWENTANWENGYPASNGTTDVVFCDNVNASTAGDCYLYASENVRTITFNSQYYQNYGTAHTGVLGQFYSSDTLTLQTGLANNSGFAISLNLPVILAGNQTWSDVAGSVTTLQMPLSGAGGLTKTGPGTVALPASNTFAGPVAVLGGTLGLIDDSSLGGSTAPIVINGGALSFSPKADFTTSRTFQLGASGAALLLGDNNSANVTFSAPFTGSGSLRLDRTGIISFNPDRFVLAADSSAVSNLMVGAATVIGQGSGQRFGSGNVSLGPFGVLGINSISNLAAGAKVTMSANSVFVSNDPSLDPAAVIDPASAAGAILSLNTAEQSAPLNMAAIGDGLFYLGATGTVHYSAPTLGADSDGVYRICGGGNLASGVANGLTISGHDNVLTGANALVVGAANYPMSPSPNSDVLPTANLTLGNANDFTGGTTLVNGRLTLAADAALGSGPLTIAPSSYGYLYLSLSNPSLTLANPFLFTGQVKNSTLTILGAGALSLSGSIDLGGARRQLSYGSGITSLTLSGTASNGTLALMYGTYVLQSVNSPATLEISTGAQAQAASDANLGAAGTTLTFSSGTLTCTSSFTSNRPISGGGAVFGVNVPAGVAVTFNGNIAGGLNKTGAGSLELTGVETAGLSMSAGTLRLTNAQSVVPVSVFAGTFASGNSISSTSINAGGVLAPGAAATPGTLTIGSGLTLYSGATLSFRLGTQASDEIVLSNTHVLQITGQVTINLADAGGLAPGQTYTLVDFGTADISGISASNFQLGSGPVGGTLSLSGEKLQIVTAALTPYQSWQRRYFGSSAAANAAFTATPANDGITNLVKYALGLNPLQPASGALPNVNNTGGILSLTYTRADAATDVTVQPQSSATLAAWDGSSVTQQTLSDNGVTQTVKATAPAGSQFMRLLVTSP